VSPPTFLYVPIPCPSLSSHRNSRPHKLL
jgi:hypothetical protein